MNCSEPIAKPVQLKAQKPPPPTSMIVTGEYKILPMYLDMWMNPKSIVPDPLTTRDMVETSAALVSPQPLDKYSDIEHTYQRGEA